MTNLKKNPKKCNPKNIKVHKVVELVGGGSVINGATLSSFYCKALWITL